MEQIVRPLKIGAIGMRGLVGDGLNTESAIAFASAFGSVNYGKRVMVAIDTRPSSRMLRHAVLSALVSCGCEVVDGGILSAGMVHFLIPHLKLAGALLITGGHQASGWNAIIPLGADGAYFDDINRRELFDIYHGRRFVEVDHTRVRPIRKLPEKALDAYWDFLGSAVDRDAIARHNFCVIGDFCNGAGAGYARRFAELFNLRLIALNDIPGAPLTRDPEPRPRTELPIRAIIAPLGAAIGLVYNSDMSRLGILTDDGEPLSEELTSPLGIDYLLEKSGKPQVVVTNCCSTRTLDEVVARRGGSLEKVKVGQAHVIEGMASHGAFAGGEGSGAFTFGSLRGFDAFLMSAVLLEMIAVRGKPLSEQLKSLPRYNIVKKTISCHSSRGYALLRRVKNRFGNVPCSEVDGLRFDWDDGFLSLRLSGTDSVIRLISESSRKSTAVERAWQVRAMLESRGGKVL